VLAANSWAAMQGRNALEVNGISVRQRRNRAQGCTNSSWPMPQSPGKSVRNDGDADAVLASSTKTIEVAYEFPFAAHACMEPMNCTFDIRPDGAEAWVPTQAPQWAQAVIAEAAKLPPEKVIVHTT